MKSSKSKKDTPQSLIHRKKRVDSGRLSCVVAASCVEYVCIEENNLLRLKAADRAHKFILNRAFPLTGRNRKSSPNTTEGLLLCPRN